MKTRTLIKNQCGDTIIEVVIAITLISALLSGALALTRTNLQAVRRSQEHGEALQLAQSQIEYIRSYITAANLPNTHFCISNSTIVVIQNGTTACNINSAQPIYSVVDIPPVGASNVYTISVSWSDVDGHATDNVSLSYEYNAS